MRSLRALTVACILVTATAAVIGTGAGAAPSKPFVSQRVADPEAADRYWTERRMAAAQPMALPKVRASELSKASGEPSNDDPYFVEGSAPTIPPSGSREYAATRGPIPFVAGTVEEPSLETYRTHGVIFGTAPQGNYGCSGTLVNSDNKSVVWTAAHCLFGDGDFFTNIVFVPGYEEGNAPFGSWPAQDRRVPLGWQSSEDPTEGHDFGAIVLAPNDEGILAGDAVGTRGIAFNQQPNELFQSFGYPARPRIFDGEHLHTCESQGTGRIFGGLIAMGCNMKEGSSGGGWVIRGEYVSSNQSIGLMGLPGLAFGPYLGSDALALYNSVRGGTTVYPQPTPTGPPAPYRKHRMRVSLRLTRHVVAKGTVTAASGHTGCTQLVPIQIARLKKSNGEFYVVGLSKTVFTRDDGTFRVKLRDRRKAFYGAVAYAGAYDLSNDCSQDLSRVKRHRHT